MKLHLILKIKLQLRRNTLTDDGKFIYLLDLKPLGLSICSPSRRPLGQS